MNPVFLSLCPQNACDEITCSLRLLLCSGGENQTGNRRWLHAQWLSRETQPRPRPGHHAPPADRSRRTVGSLPPSLAECGSQKDSGAAILSHHHSSLPATSSHPTRPRSPTGVGRVTAETAPTPAPSTPTVGRDRLPQPPQLCSHVPMTTLSQLTTLRTPPVKGNTRRAPREIPPTAPLRSRWCFITLDPRTPVTQLLPTPSVPPRPFIPHPRSHSVSQSANIS